MNTQTNSNSSFTFLRAKIPVEIHTEIAVKVARERRDWSEVITEILRSGLEKINDDSKILPGKVESNILLAKEKLLNAIEVLTEENIELKEKLKTDKRSKNNGTNLTHPATDVNRQI